jgi:hypothetical protein
VTLTVLPAFSVTLYKKYCPSTTNSGDIVYQPTEIYFPIPPTATDVPTAPTIDTEPELIPGNSAVVDECFDPDNVDLSQIFNNLLPAVEVEPVYDASITTDVLLQPRNQIYPIRAVLRSIFGIYTAGYSTIPKLTEVPAFAVRAVGTYYRLKVTLEPVAGAIVLVGKNISLQKNISIFCARGLFVWSGISANLNYQGNRFISADSGSFVINNEPEVLVLSHFDSYDTYGFAEETGNTVGYNWYYNKRPDISTTIKKFGAGSLQFGYDYFLYTYLDPARFNQFIPEFTIEIWSYPTSSSQLVMPFGVGPEASDTSTGCLINLYRSSSSVAQNGYIQVLQQTGQANFVTVFGCYSLDLLSDQWYHIVLEQSIEGLRVYLDGVNIPNQQLVGAPLVWPLSGGIQGIDIRGSIQLGDYFRDPGTFRPYATYGQIDELRIVAAALYNGQSFTPPTVAYTTQSPSTIFAGLNKIYNLTSLSGTFTLTGQAIGTATPSLVIVTEAAAFTLSGQNISFVRPSRVVSAEAGAFTATFVPSIDRPSIVGSKTASADGNGFNFSWPSGYVENDLAIIFTETSNAYSYDRPITPPYGWVQVPNSIGTDNLSYSSAFYKFARSSTEPDVTIGSNGDHVACVMVIFRGVDTVNPFVEASFGVDPSDNSSVTFPLLSEIVPRTRIIESFTAGADSSVTLSLSGRSNASNSWVDAGLINGVSTGLSNGGSIVVYNATTTKQTQGLPGSTGTLNENRTNTLITIALRPEGWIAPPFVVNFAPVAGSYALVGQAAGLTVPLRTLGAADGTYTLVGYSASFQKGLIMAAESTTYNLGGQSAGLSLPSKSLVVDAGAFVEVGQDANLLDNTAYTYIAAVESADGQDLETTVKVAINKFITGCKADGTWSAIKAACILAGARTLAGALVPLVGTAPTNNNFVSGDYNRKTGLIGNGSNKHLNTNRADNADPQNDAHVSVYVSTPGTKTGSNNEAYIGASNNVNSYREFLRVPASNGTFAYVRTAAGASGGTLNAVGFLGASRSGSASFVYRREGTPVTISQTSAAPSSNTVGVFAERYTSVINYTTARLSFYSLGESLDLALLDSRVTTLMSDIAAALP